MADYESDSEATNQPDLEGFEDDEIDLKIIIDMLGQLMKMLDTAIEDCNIFAQAMGFKSQLENKEALIKEFRNNIITPFYIYTKNKLYKHDQEEL